MSFGRLARLQGAAAAAAQAAVSTWRPVPLAALAGAGVLPSRGFATVFGNFSQYNEPEGGWARAEEQSRRQEVVGKGVPGGRRGEDDVAAECRPAAKPRRPPTANPANKESGGAAGAWRECDGDMLGNPMQNSSCDVTLTATARGPNYNLVFLSS